MLCPYHKNQRLKKIKVKKRTFDHQIDELIDPQDATFHNVKFDLSSKLSQNLSTKSLKCLSLTKCQLLDLEYFPEIPTLKALYLDDNFLEVESLGQLRFYYDKLDTLSLTSNNINFSLLANCVGSLSNFTKLTQLNVLKNFFHPNKEELFDQSFYISQRKNFFKFIPTLELLDCMPLKGKKETNDILKYFRNEAEQRFFLKYILKYNLEEGEHDVFKQEDENKISHEPQQQEEMIQEKEVIEYEEKQTKENLEEEKDKQFQQNQINQSSSQQTNSQSLSSNPYGEFNSPQLSKQEKLQNKKKKKDKKTKKIKKEKKTKTKTRNKESSNSSKKKQKIGKQQDKEVKPTNSLRRSRRLN